MYIIYTEAFNAESIANDLDLMNQAIFVPIGKLSSPSLGHTILQKVFPAGENCRGLREVFFLLAISLFIQFQKQKKSIILLRSGNPVWSTPKCIHNTGGECGKLELSKVQGRKFT